MPKDNDVLFITADGVPMKIGDTFWCADPTCEERPHWIMVMSDSYRNREADIKYFFSTREAAQAFIDQQSK